VPTGIVKERARRLREKGAARLCAHLSASVGRPLEVLTERGGMARAADFTPMRLRAEPPPGELLVLAASGHDGQKLLQA
jgi:threonylcarbamoyladenosine tRNA methylthiotransferase MtaB